MKIDVKETRDYGMFQRLEGNRDVKCVKKIINSINTVGYIPNPIIVNENMEVIDGQNRLQACELMSLPVYYYIIKGATIDTARSLNLGRTNWKPIDYVKSYAESGNKSYMMFLDLMEKNPNYSLQEMFGIVTNNIVKTGWTTKRLESGIFEMTKKEYTEAQTIIDMLNQMSKAIKNIKGSSRLIISGLAWCLRIDGCDANRMIRSINKYYPLIDSVVDGDAVAYLKQITDIYNKDIRDRSKKICFDGIYRGF